MHDKYILFSKEEQLNELFEIFEEVEYIRNDVAAVEYEYLTQLKVDSTRMDITITLYYISRILFMFTYSNIFFN